MSAMRLPKTDLEPSLSSSSRCLLDGSERVFERDVIERFENLIYYGQVQYYVDVGGKAGWPGYRESNPVQMREFENDLGQTAYCPAGHCVF